MSWTARRWTICPRLRINRRGARPVYEEMPGWSESTEGARSWADLPANAIKYVRRVEELIDCPVALLSTSPEREDTILVTRSRLPTEEMVMALRYKTRKRLALLILVFGLPLYTVAAVSLVALFERPSIWIELLIYVGLGVIWAIPLKFVFKGIGQPDPDD